MRVKWGVLISGNGSTLQSILDCQDILDVTVVISSRASAYGLARARRAGVPTEIVPKFENKKDAEEWICQTLEKYRVHYIFLAGFMRIVSGQLINKYKGKIFNIHPSLLPKYKGINGFEQALEAGDDDAGVTVHRVALEVDSGENILQNRFKIPFHRDKDLSQLWLHINEKRALIESMRKISCQK